jgi:dTDP-4-dehydrorhamnose 3,5-epimerase
VVSEVAQVEYKCSAFYDPQDELVVAWNDPDLGIEWPVDDPVLSERDRSASTLSDLEHLLPHYQIPA